MMIPAAVQLGAGRRGKTLPRVIVSREPISVPEKIEIEIEIDRWDRYVLYCQVNCQLIIQAGARLPDGEE